MSTPPGSGGLWSFNVTRESNQAVFTQTKRRSQQCRTIKSKAKTTSQLSHIMHVATESNHATKRRSQQCWSPKAKAPTTYQPMDNISAKQTFNDSVIHSQNLWPVNSQGWWTRLLSSLHTARSCSWGHNYCHRHLCEDGQRSFDRLDPVAKWLALQNVGWIHWKAVGC